MFSGSGGSGNDGGIKNAVFAFGSNKTSTTSATSSLEKRTRRRSAHGGTPAGGAKARAFAQGKSFHGGELVNIEADEYEDGVHGLPEQCFLEVEYSEDRRAWTRVEIAVGSIRAAKPLVLAGLRPRTHYFVRTRQRNGAGWSSYNPTLLQVATRDYRVGDRVLWWNTGPWTSEHAFTPGRIVGLSPLLGRCFGPEDESSSVEPLTENFPISIDRDRYAVEAGGIVTSVRCCDIKETQKNDGQEAKARWKMISSLVESSKKHVLTKKHRARLKSTTRTRKSSMQLMADRHEEVQRYLSLDDVDMTPGNRVRVADVAVRKGAEGVSFQATAQVLMFASKLRRRAKRKALGRREGERRGRINRINNLVPIANATDMDREMRNRLSMARRGNWGKAKS